MPAIFEKRPVSAVLRVGMAVILLLRRGRGELTGTVEVGGGLDGIRLDALHRPAGDAGERAAGDELDEPGHTHVHERLLAEVPAHGIRDLGDEEVDIRLPGFDHGAVGVREDRQVRVGDAETGRGLGESGNGGSHVVGVEGTGDRRQDDPGALGRVVRESLQVRKGACGNGLAAAVDVGGADPGGFDGGEDIGRFAADDGRHPGRCLCGGRGHAGSADGDEAHRISGREDTGDLGSGDLSDGMPGDDVGSDPEFGGARDRRGDEEAARARCP